MFYIPGNKSGNGRASGLKLHREINGAHYVETQPFSSLDDLGCGGKVEMFVCLFVLKTDPPDSR